MSQVMIDVTGAALPGLLTALQGRYPGVLGGYVTGTPDIDWPAFYWTELAGHVGLFRYDQSPGLALYKSGGADCADIESGAASISDFIADTADREKRGWYSWGYASHSLLADLRTAVLDAGYRKVRFVVADWNMNLATAEAFLAANHDVDAVQWASPTSNPTNIAPGTSRTLSELNCDLNVARDGWFTPPAIPKPPRTLSGVSVRFTDGSTVQYGD